MEGWMYLSQSFHFLDLGAQPGLHAAYFPLAALQFLLQSFQTLSLLCQSVLLLFQLCCLKLQFSLFLHHDIFTCVEAVRVSLNTFVQTAVKNSKEKK